jgi:hypothetical protein
VKPVVSSWPVCGKCCEVAPFAWLGGAHCGGKGESAEPGEYEEGGVDTSPGSIAARHQTFSHCLNQAIQRGERSGGSCMGIDDETFGAINAVAGEFPNATIASIAAAHEEFARDVRGIHFFESKATVMACRAGVIPQQMQPTPTLIDAPSGSAVNDDTPSPLCSGVDDDRPTAVRRKKRPPAEYGAHSITIIVPDPEAAREWILANRADPSDLYREYVLNGDWRPSCCD